MVGDVTATDIIIGPISSEKPVVAASAIKRRMAAKSYLKDQNQLEDKPQSLAVRIVSRIIEILLVAIVFIASAILVAVVTLLTPVVLGASAVLGFAGVEPDYRWRSVDPA